MFVLILSNYLNFNIIYVLMKTIQQDFRPLFFLFRTPFDTGQPGPNCADSENLALLTLFGLIAKDTPALLEPSIPQLCECLSQQSTAPPTLQVLQDIAIKKPKCLVDHMYSFKLTAAISKETSNQNTGHWNKVDFTAATASSPN